MKPKTGQKQFQFNDSHKRFIAKAVTDLMAVATEKDAQRLVKLAYADMSVRSGVASPRKYLEGVFVNWMKNNVTDVESEAFYQHYHGKDGLSLAAHLGLADKAGWDDDYYYPELVDILDHNTLFDEIDGNNTADRPQTNTDAGNSSMLSIDDDDLPFLY